MALAVRGSDNGIYWRKYDGSTWSGWTRLPGSTIDSPAICLLDNDLHMAVMGSDTRIYHGWIDLDTDAFSGWNKLSGSTPNAPVLVPLP
jgi:hypothetical protein